MSLAVAPGYVSNPLAVDVPAGMSIPKLIHMRSLRAPDEPMIERKTELGSAWLPVRAGEFWQQIRSLGAALIDWGVDPGDAVVLFAPTSCEWTLLDVALQAIGAIVVPIYESDSPTQIEWIIRDSGARKAWTQNRGQGALVQSVAEIDVAVIDEGDVDRFLARGVGANGQVEERMEALTSTDVATIVYTSGTTGRPRGVPLTHSNLAVTILQDLPFFPEAVREPSVRLLLFLPMAHIYARTAGYMALVGNGVCGHVPNTRNLVDDMVSFAPTTIGAVPRVLEKIYAAAKAKAAPSLIKRTIFSWCEKVAAQRAERLIADEEETIGQRVVYRIARALVFSKLEKMLGGNMRYIVSGGAPLAARIERFFTGMGMRLYQGYGLTEVSGGVICNNHSQRKLGSVGVPPPGTSVRIAADGEVELAGPCLFDGYYGESSQEDVFTPDGWFRTGDLGRIDEEGFVYISGRKKELIVTAGGKNVQPTLVEEAIRQHPLVSQVVAVGEGQPFIAALLTLDSDALPGWLDAHKLPRMDQAAAATNERVHEALARAIARANEQVSRAESVRKFTILPGDFTEANGLLTPSLKVRRAMVCERYASEIAALYASGTKVGVDVDR